MELCGVVRPRSFRIGEILIRSGMISKERLTEALSQAETLGLPVGKVLIALDYVSKLNLQAVLQAQSLLREGLIDEDLAFEVLQLVSDRKKTFDAALKELGWEGVDSYKKIPRSRLGDLLLDAGIMSREDIAAALELSVQVNLPLGRVLVLKGKISDSLMATALNCLAFFQDARITREEAVRALREAYERRKELEAMLSRDGRHAFAAPQTVRLGELLMLAGIVTDLDVDTALEQSVLNSQPIGQVFVENGNIDSKTLEHALQLQSLVHKRTLSALHAAEALRQIHFTNVSFDQAVAEQGCKTGHVERHKPKIVELLELTENITKEELDRAIEESVQNSSLVGKILLNAGVIDEATLYAALRCEFLLSEEILTIEQAILALLYSQSRKVSFDDALDELGWTVPTKMEWVPED